MWGIYSSRFHKRETERGLCSRDEISMLHKPAIASRDFTMEDSVFQAKGLFLFVLQTKVSEVYIRKVT